MKPKVDAIFCITTGRSGTGYLAELFKASPVCEVYHEAEPVGNGAPMRAFLKGNPRMMERIAEVKMEKIRSANAKGKVYVETSHLFIKGWGWLLPKMDPNLRLGVIVLKRDPEKIVQSHLRIGAWPTLPKGRNWIITPETKNPITPPPKRFVSARITYKFFVGLSYLLRGKRFWNRLGLRHPAPPTWLLDRIVQYNKEALFWYVDELFSRGEKFMKAFPEVQTTEIWLESLNNPHNVFNLFSFFGLPVDHAVLERIIGRRVNAKAYGNFVQHLLE